METSPKNRHENAKGSESRFLMLFQLRTEIPW
jgi:hypothetical protein